MSATCRFCNGELSDGVCEDCGKSNLATPLVTPDAGGSVTPFVLPDAATTKMTRTVSTQFRVNYPTRMHHHLSDKSEPSASAQVSRRRNHFSTKTSTRRTALGGGLISLPDLPSQDPLKLLLVTPEVPYKKRQCSQCASQVNRTKGFCPSCGTPYDFIPHLKAGDVVAGKYEIKGPIAFGGLGWIYLGFDQILQRWVVLKGLLNANDTASAAVAVAERRYLAAVKHPKIVGIYDFVNQDTEGFIVMEYVGGQTLQSLRKERGPLPVTEAIAYILGILPAFSYLHRQGLVYCDFKPDNAMLELGDIKLIDMGAVRKIDDPDGDIYATVGYAAPEADNNPTAMSDLYTLGRALAVLIMDFTFTTQYRYTLPAPEQVEVLANNESLTRFLLRATHADPDERFQNADEMGNQLFGVLREIVALQTGPKPAESKVFSGDKLTHLSAQVLPQFKLDFLPAIRIDMDDPASSEVISIMSLMDSEDKRRQIQKLAEIYSDKLSSNPAEPKLRYIEIMMGSSEQVFAQNTAQMTQYLDDLKMRNPFDWRVNWYQGIAALIKNEGALAMLEFEHCYFELPGELAPKLAMGYAAELMGDIELALTYYDRVGRVDPSYISAHAGAARCHAKAGRLQLAIDMLKRVPTNNVLYQEALLAIGEMLVEHENSVDAALLEEGEAAINLLLSKVKNEQVCKVAAQLCALAIKIKASNIWPVRKTFLGHIFTEKALRLAAEQQFRQAAIHANTVHERHRLIVLANQVRPLTLF